MGSTLAGATTVTTPALRYWRTQAALRQSELAKRAGVHETSVRRGESGAAVQLATVRKLAEALGVTPAELQRRPPNE
jgi:transcriptional regulator with XRE-family HTH domain